MTMIADHYAGAPNKSNSHLITVIRGPMPALFLNLSFNQQAGDFHPSL